MQAQAAEGVDRSRVHLANFQAVFGNLTGEDARPTLWRGRPRPRFGRCQQRPWSGLRTSIVHFLRSLVNCACGAEEQVS